MGYLQVCHVVGRLMGCLLAQLQLLLAVSNLFLQLTHTPHAIIGLQLISLCVNQGQPLSLLSVIPFNQCEYSCEVNACSWQLPILSAALNAHLCVLQHTYIGVQTMLIGRQAMIVIRHKLAFHSERWRCELQPIWLQDTSVTTKWLSCHLLLVQVSSPIPPLQLRNFCLQSFTLRCAALQLLPE